MPKISIITVTYNAEAVLEKTMLSVLNQTDCDYEYIIVDGNSTDETFDLINKYESKIENKEFFVSKDRFRWISEPDKGLYDAMNKGIDIAIGDFLWFINAGDKIYSPTTLSKIQKAIQDNPNTDIFYGQSLIIDENDNPLGERHKIAPKTLKKKSLLNGLVVCHQLIIVRKSIAPFYDLQYRITSDYDWTIKVLSKSKHNIYIDDYLSKFRIAGLSSINREKSWKERYHIMRKHFGITKTLWAHFKIIIKYPFTRKY
jgi:glycosyltransferase involved in cell wall biosynthesis